VCSRNFLQHSISIISPEEKRHSFFECVSLCLSRACLGKRIGLMYKWLKRRRFYAPNMCLISGSASVCGKTSRISDSLIPLCRNTTNDVVLFWFNVSDISHICFVPSLSWQNVRFLVDYKTARTFNFKKRGTFPHRTVFGERVHRAIVLVDVRTQMQGHIPDLQPASDL
jgi:hypothetical protein